MSDYDYDEDDQPGFFQKYGLAIAMAVVVPLVAGGGLAAYFFAGKIKPPKKPDEIMVRLMPPPLPPPPPPPPPPLKTPPPEPKMVEQPKVKPDEVKPKEAKNDRPPGPAGPKASGPPTDDGIGGSGGSGGDGIGDGDGGSRWGWYAGEVQARIADALRQNDKTKDAQLRLKVRIWSDSSGRITRAEISGSSGDSSIDDSIKNQVLVGLQLQEPPPSDMPMPIVMMISEQRPN